MKILINDFEQFKEVYAKIFNVFGYEPNELIFCKSFEQTKGFIEDYLDRRKLHVDLIITNDSSESSINILKSSELSFLKNSTTSSFSKGNFRIRIRYRNYIGKWFDYLLVSRKEMKAILKGTGWKVKKFIDTGNSVYIAIIEKR